MSYIKKLVMHGFKSFPKKTEIPFTRGINVILGPNGSGKSNVSDAICFVLGRLSAKSMRAAKASNLIFLGTKSASPAKEASVEIILDNSNKSFSLKEKEVSIKRIVRRNGQSIYKINNKTKTRQEVLFLLAQAGIDPQGFNIILQGEIQNFVRIHTEERRKVIEEVSGISVYESRKQKSLRELEKTEERLKEINSILRERTIYLENLEKERKQALKFQKLQKDLKVFKASIIHHDLTRKNKELENLNLNLERKFKESAKVKNSIVLVEAEIKNLNLKTENINSKIKDETGLEQEKINQDIANLRAELAGLNVRFENQESKLSELSTEKEEIKDSIRESEISLKELMEVKGKGKNFASEKTLKELSEKKKTLENLEEKRKKFYMAKSEISSLTELIEDKINFFQTSTTEADFLLKQIESLTIEIFDTKSNNDKLEKLKISLADKRDIMKNVLSREAELEKTNYANEAEIESQAKIIEKISKLDICPICKNKITPKHMDEINSELNPLIDSLKENIKNSDKQLKGIYERKDILEKDIEQILTGISRTEIDLGKISKINDKKSQIRNLQEKTDKTKEELEKLRRRKKQIQTNLEEMSGIEKRYEILKIEIENVSLRTKENVDSEVSFKRRELERMNVSLKEILRSEEDSRVEKGKMGKIVAEKNKILSQKKMQEEALNAKFKKLILERDSFQSKIRDLEIEISRKRNFLENLENGINEFKISKARIDAEAENLKTELLEYSGIEIIKTKKEILVQKLSKTNEILSNIGSVNMRSLEVYDSIKKEYDSIREKSEIIGKEKESIFKIIHEIDLKKKKAFLKTLNELNELFSRNFSQLSTKGQVYLELENRKEPFGGGVNIIVKTGHGKYFDVRSLSGGEQTLVALSLIFAIQELKPYYFYLLDEIDAALDKRNSERLASLLTKYMQKGQYIVISHNDEIITKATNLYGVSMHDGISKVISLKI